MTRQTWRNAVVILWLGALGLTTSARCHVWQSDDTLWADAAAKAPLKPRTVMNEGRAHELSGDILSAERAYRRVIWLSHDERRTPYIRAFSQAAAETNIAHLYMKQGHLATAMRVLDSTLSQWPNFPYAHYNRGAILWMVGACDDARQEYARALSGDPTLPHPKEPCQATHALSTSAS